MSDLSFDAITAAINGAFMRCSTCESKLTEANTTLTEADTARPVYCDRCVRWRMRPDQR